MRVRLFDPLPLSPDVFTKADLTAPAYETQRSLFSAYAEWHILVGYNLRWANAPREFAVDDLTLLAHLALLSDIAEHEDVAEAELRIIEGQAPVLNVTLGLP